MKLYTAIASPFGRVVKVVVYELGLEDDVETVITKVAPTQPNKDYQTLNPLRKIPALEIEDGTVLADSALIAQYLAERVGDSRLFAVGAPDHWRVLADYSVAKGMADCAVATRYETWLRPDDARWPAWTEDQMDKVNGGLAHFEAAPPATDGRFTIAAIALGCALGYLDFRFPDRNWRADYPKLAAWAEPVLARPSFQATRPE